MTDQENEATKNDDTKVDAAEQKKQKIIAAYKGYKAQGFNKEQAAQQLSSKFAITVDEARAAIENSGEDGEKKEDA